MDYESDKIVAWVKQIGESAGKLDKEYQVLFNRIATEITTVEGPAVSTKLVYLVDGLLNEQMTSVIKISKEFSSTLDSLIDNLSYDPKSFVSAPNKFLEYVKSLDDGGIKDIVSIYSDEIEFLNKVKQAPYVGDVDWDHKIKLQKECLVLFVGNDFDLWKRQFVDYVAYVVGEVSNKIASSIYSKIKIYLNKRINEFIDSFSLDDEDMLNANQLYSFLKDFDEKSGLNSDWSIQFTNKLSSKINDIVNSALPQSKNSSELINKSKILSNYVKVLNSDYEILKEIGGDKYIELISNEVNQLIKIDNAIDFSYNYDTFKKLNSELMGLIGLSFDSSEIDALLEFKEDLPNFIDPNVFSSYLNSVVLRSGVHTIEKLTDKMIKYTANNYKIDDNAAEFAKLYLKIKNVLGKYSNCTMLNYFLDGVEEVRSKFENKLIKFFSEFGGIKSTGLNSASNNVTTPYDDLIDELKSTYKDVFPNLVNLLVSQIRNYTKIKNLRTYLSNFGFKESKDVFGTDPVPHIAAPTVMELFNNVEPAVKRYLQVVNQIGLDVGTANKAVEALRKSAESMKREYLSNTKCPFNFSDNAQSIYENLHLGVLDKETYLRLISSVSEEERSVLDAIARYYSLDIDTNNDLVEFVGKVISIVESNSNYVPDELFFDMLKYKYPNSGKPIVLNEIIDEVWAYKKQSMHLDNNEILSYYLNKVDGGSIKDTPVEREYVKNAIKSL